VRSPGDAHPGTVVRHDAAVAPSGSATEAGQSTPEAVDRSVERVEVDARATGEVASLRPDRVEAEDDALAWLPLAQRYCCSWPSADGVSVGDERRSRPKQRDERYQRKQTDGNLEAHAHYDQVTPQKAGASPLDVEWASVRE